MSSSTNKVMARVGPRLLIALSDDAFAPSAYVLDGKLDSDVRPFGVFSKFAMNANPPLPGDSVDSAVLNEIRRLARTPQYEKLWGKPKM